MVLWLLSLHILKGLVKYIIIKVLVCICIQVMWVCLQCIDIFLYQKLSLLFSSPYFPALKTQFFKSPFPHKCYQIIYSVVSGKNHSFVYHVETISVFVLRSCHNFILYSVSCAKCLWNMVSYAKGWTQAKVIWKQYPEASIWAQTGKELEWRRLHHEELHISYSEGD